MSNQRLLFSKGGKARFISHLDLMRTMQRALLRTGLTIRHTEGYHPHPYLSIPLPLPLGFTSACEILEFGLLDGATMEELPARIGNSLPEGIVVHQCYDGGLAFKKLSYVRYEIAMDFDGDVSGAAAEALRDLIVRESHIITKRSKKAKSGQTEVDIIPLIHSLQALTPSDRHLELDIILRAQNPGLNPDLLVGALRSEFPDLAPDFVSFHRKEVLDETLNLYR